MSNRARRDRTNIDKSIARHGRGVKEKKAGHRGRLEKAFVLCTPDNWHKKLAYLSEASCFIAIRMENKEGICAPYKCPHCTKWHMTSDKDTVRKFYRDRRKNRGTV